MIHAPYRRRFLAAVLAATWRPGFAQGTRTVPRVGLMLNTIAVADLGNPDKAGPAPKIIEDGLRALGWIPGRNIELVWKSVDGRFERWPQVVDEFVRLPVDVLVVFSDNAALVALQRTQSIPIVMLTVGAAVRDGVVRSLGRPGTNLTGFSFEQPPQLNGKRLALLKQAAPSISSVAFLAELPDEMKAHPGFSAETQAAARALGVALIGVGFKSEDQIEPAFADAVGKGANAVVVPYGIRLYKVDVQQRIHALAIRHRMPVMHYVPRNADSGGLMAYGFDDLDIYRRLPYFIDRILRGAKPSDLPIEQPTRFVLVINQRAAKAIGLAIPRSLLAQADRVIE